MSVVRNHPLQLSFDGIGKHLADHAHLIALRAPD
jgi:hypothetical protein